MESLKRPLLSDGTLATIAEVEVERSTPLERKTSTTSLPETNGSENATTSEPGREGRGERSRSTWGGRESRPRPSQNKPKRATDLATRGRRQELDYPQPLRNYNIHEEGYGLEPPYRLRTSSEVNSAPSTRTSSFSEGGLEENGNMDEEEVVIDGGGSIDGRDDFVDVGLDTTLEGMSTTKELTRCKKTVLVLYLNFLKVIGWRRWRGPRQDLDTPLYTNVLNFLYPSFIFFLMVAACVTQTLTCFYRDEVRYGPVERGILVVRCTEHILTRSVIADVLLLAAYLFGVYFFRYKEPEHLSALMERVYLSFNFKHRVSPQRRLTFTLRMILSLSAVWVLLSLAGNILRLFSLSLLNNTTYFALISTIPATNATATNTTVPMNRSLMENITRYALVIYSIIGFVLFDMLYVAVVVSYASHAQLLLTYINSVIDKVQTKACDLGKAIRDMSQIYESLKVLNATLSHLTSVCLFIFITTSISSLVGLASINVDPEMGRYRNIHISVGVINFVQWTLLALAPITQASRLTSTCRRLRRLGLEIGARPFSYHDTPQLVLDSFLQYTNATRYTAKLAGVPIYPKGVIGFFFVFGIVATWALVKFNPFSFASWF